MIEGGTMLKSDFSEVKRALKPKFGNIKEIWATYANMEKTILFSSKKEMLSLSEEEQLVYSNLFSKVLSGKRDRNLFIFPTDSSKDVENTLYSISKDGKDEAVKTLTNKIIAEYKASDSFAVLVATVTYDIPSYASDGTKLEGSDGLYQFMIGAICPTKLEKPNLIYKRDKNFFEKAHRDFVLQTPEIGLLYPIFENREPNANKLLYFAKKSKKDSDLHPELLSNIFEADLPVTSEVQMVDFAEKINESFEGKKDVRKLFDVKSSIEERQFMLEMSGEEPVLSKDDINDIFVKNGGKEVEFEEDISLAAVSSDKLVISGANGLKINLTAEDVKTILQKNIDGRNYLLIPTEDLSFNGVSLK